MQLAFVETGLEGGSINATSTSAGHSTENCFNALNAKIATTGEDGVWREFGVDAAGNAVMTSTYGKQGNKRALVSYAQFDALNRQVANYDVAYTVYGESTADTPSPARATTSWAMSCPRPTLRARPRTSSTA